MPCSAEGTCDDQTEVPLVVRCVFRLPTSQAAFLTCKPNLDGINHRMKLARFMREVGTEPMSAPLLEFALVEIGLRGSATVTAGPYEF